METALSVLQVIWLAGYGITVPLMVLALWFRKQFPNGERRQWVVNGALIMLFALGVFGGLGVVAFFVLDQICFYAERRRKAILESVMCKVREQIAEFTSKGSSMPSSLERKRSDG